MAEARIDPQAAFRASLPKEAAKIIPTRPGPGTLPSEVEKQEAVIRQAIAENPTDTPAQTLAEKLATADKTTLEQVQTALDENIGTERNADGTRNIPAAGTPEAARRDAAQAFDAANAELIANKGVVDLTEARFSHIVQGLDQIIDMGEGSYIRPAARLNIYKAMLKDEGIRDAIVTLSAKRLAERLSGEEEVVEARRKAAEADSKHSAATTRQTEAGDMVTRLTDRDTALKPGGVDHPTLLSLRGRNLRRERDDAELNRKGAERDYRVALENERRNPADATLVVARQNAEHARNTADTSYNAVLADIAQLESFETEIRSLPQQLREARQEKSTADAEFSAADAAKNIADAAKSSAILKRANAESAWVNGKKDLVRDAVQQVMDTNMQKVVEADSARIEKQARETADERERKRLQNRRNKYFKPGKNGRPEIDKITPKQDMAKLLTVGMNGPEEILREELVAAGYPPDQVREKMSDKAWVDAQSAELAQQVATAFVQGGGKLRGADYAFIETQPWGKEIVDKALATSAPVQEADRKLKEAGIHEGIKAFKGKGLLAVILAILAGAGLAVLAAANKVGIS